MKDLRMSVLAKLFLAIACLVLLPTIIYGLSVLPI